MSATKRKGIATLREGVGNRWEATPAAAEAATYIVRVDSSSKPSIFPTHYHWYSSEFADPARILHTYDTVFHGFSATLTGPQASALLRHPNVLAAFEDRRRRLHTTRSPQFLGLRNQRGLWSESDYGSDIIVGVFDTGITPERRSFSDRNLGPVPKRWKGVCEAGVGFSSRSCNRKIVGARFFAKGSEAAGRSAGPAIGINETVEFRSPRDADGHGTHTASTAAGRYTFQASMAGYAPGIAKGVAPKARIASYKVCWKDSGCFDSDILAAFDAAVKDGVDVISISIGGGDGSSPPYYLDPIAIGSYGAVAHGVFVSASAGNDGPNGMSVTNLAPWLTTVGAGTIDRNFPADVTLGNRVKLSGVSLYSGPPLGGKMNQRISDESTGKPASPYDFGAGHLHLDLAMDPGLVYDITNDDYVSFLCAIGYSNKVIQVITRSPANCPAKKPLPENLNYPSISALFLTSSTGVQSKTFIRTVTNVGQPNAVYRVRVESAPKGVTISVKPAKLVFTEAVKKQSYVVTVSADTRNLELGNSGAAFGSLAWSDGKHVVRSPIAVTEITMM
ncbi:hypothetical protein NL676_015401 [Syzygium grande]|nr:hypothetical protein NL676_015401 [Syzygium grande]